MSFKAVVIKREDGDYDVLCGFNVEQCELIGGKSANEYAKEFTEFLRSDDVQAKIIDIQNITDVIESEYIPVKANWNFTLDATCPSCNECVDVTAESSFWNGKNLKSGEYGTEDSTNIDATCHLCGHEFKITCEFE